MKLSEKQVQEMQQKCTEIMIAIVERCNEQEKGDGWQIAFGPDWGGNSLTIYDSAKGHTHVGGITEDHSSFEELVDQMHDQLTKGRGLSWA